MALVTSMLAPTHEFLNELTQRLDNEGTYEYFDINRLKNIAVESEEWVEDANRVSELEAEVVEVEESVTQAVNLIGSIQNILDGDYDHDNLVKEIKVVINDSDFK